MLRRDVCLLVEEHALPDIGEPNDSGTRPRVVARLQVRSERSVGDADRNLTERD